MCDIFINKDNCLKSKFEFNIGEDLIGSFLYQPEWRDYIKIIVIRICPNSKFTIAQSIGYSIVFRRYDPNRKVLEDAKTNIEFKNTYLLADPGVLTANQISAKGRSMM